MPEINLNQLPFSEAIEYFSQKISIDTDSWVEGQGIIQNVAFTVAGAKGAILQDIRDAVDAAINDGISIADFAKRFDRIADSYVDNWQLKGDRAWRSQLIYDQNLRQAYGAGRYRQMTEPSVVKSRPYWQWQHGDSRVPRPTHLAMNNKVFPADSLNCFPPCGFSCRCTVFSVSQRDVDREGLTVEDVSDFEADKGFQYLPGKLTKERRDELLKNLDPDIRKLVLGDTEVEFKLPEGATRRRNGVNYTLKNSRWHRATNQEYIPKSRAERASDIYQLTQQFETEMDSATVIYRDVAKDFIYDLIEMGNRDRAEKQAERMVVKGANLADQKATIESSIDFCQLVDKPMAIKSIEFVNDRASADLENGIVRLTKGKSPLDSRITQFHEMAHHCEYEDKSAGMDAEEWVKSRATGEITPLSELTGNNKYGGDESAYPDSFIDPYVGKFYGQGITEVHSMGLQAFADPDKLVDLYKRDPGHFRLIMEYIRK